jgi:hypothetical protein
MMFYSKADTGTKRLAFRSLSFLNAILRIIWVISFIELGHKIFIKSNFND